MSSERAVDSAPPVSSLDFRRACGRFATGVAVAAAIDPEGAPHGITINSFSSVSLDPPLILICLGHAVAAIEVFRRARHFGLSVLRDDQQHLSERFARRVDNHFDGLPWRLGKTGAPLLDDVLAQIECSPVNRIAAGDHDIFIAEMSAVELFEGDPLIYYASDYRALLPQIQ